MTFTSLIKLDVRKCFPLQIFKHLYRACICPYSKSKRSSFTSSKSFGIIMLLGVSTSYNKCYQIKKCIIFFFCFLPCIKVAICYLLSTLSSLLNFSFTVLVVLESKKSFFDERNPFFACFFSFYSTLGALNLLTACCFHMVFQLKYVGGVLATCTKRHD